MWLYDINRCMRSSLSLDYCLNILIAGARCSAEDIWMVCWILVAAAELADMRAMH